MMRLSGLAISAFATVRRQPHLNRTRIIESNKPQTLHTSEIRSRFKRLSYIGPPVISQSHVPGVSLIPQRRF